MSRKYFAGMFALNILLLLFRTARL